MSVPVIVDLETLPTDDPKLMSMLTAAVKPPGQYKKEDSIKAWWASEGQKARADAVARTALDGSYGRIAVLGFKISDDDPQFLTTKLASEAEVIQEFTNEVNRRVIDPRDVVYVAHNARFDVSFLWKRSRILRVPLPQFWPMERYDKHRYCTMEAWAGYGEFIKQTMLEYILGIERPDDIDGSHVADLIAAGDWDTVVKHCRYDVENLAEIYRRLTA